ncbi:MAG: hypothetical protein ABIG66_01140 [Candidatus Kerfeldbacteria bacterium]
MFLSDGKTIENIIIWQLKSGPQSTVGLIAAVQKERRGTTKQGVYRVLRELKKQEAVVIHKKEVSLNIRWLNKLYDFTSLAQHFYYEKSIGTGHFANLQEGEKIKYTFNNLSLTDAFWNHALYILHQIVPDAEPWYAYDPHVWFYIARLEDETALMKRMSARRQYLITSGHNDPMDKVVSQYIDGTTGQYHMLKKPLFDDESYYFNILGDFLIEVWFDREVAKAITAWYASTKKMTDTAVEDLRKIIQSEGKTKLVISCNKKKADRLKKRISRYFYIPAA